MRRRTPGWSMRTIASKSHNWSLFKMWLVNLDVVRDGGSASSAVDLLFVSNITQLTNWILPWRRPSNERSVRKGKSCRDEGDEESFGSHHEGFCNAARPNRVTLGGKHVIWCERKLNSRNSIAFWFLSLYNVQVCCFSRLLFSSPPVCPNSKVCTRVQSLSLPTISSLSIGVSRPRDAYAVMPTYQRRWTLSQKRSRCSERLVCSFPIVIDP